MKVKLIYSTYWNGRKRSCGEELTVDSAIAERWIANGIAQSANDTVYGGSPTLLNREDLEKLPLGKLQEYVETHVVDVGRATTEKGILEKIIEAGKVLADTGA